MRESRTDAGEKGGRTVGIQRSGIDEASDGLCWCCSSTAYAYLHGVILHPNGQVVFFRCHTKQVVFLSGDCSKKIDKLIVYLHKGCTNPPLIVVHCRRVSCGYLPLPIKLISARTRLPYILSNEIGIFPLWVPGWMHPGYDASDAHSLLYPQPHRNLPHG